MWKPTIIAIACAALIAATLVAMIVLADPHRRSHVPLRTCLIDGQRITCRQPRALPAGRPSG
jgi:hypothetical protein